MTWTPATFEDRLLARYLEDHPGTLFLELPLGGSDPSHGPRRLDGLLIPGSESLVHRQATYSLEQARKAIAGQLVHLLEAKRHLNRNVIGQVEVGTRMLREAFGPTEIVKVAVCTDGNRDLVPVCESMGIRAVVYDDAEVPGTVNPGVQTEDGRIDVRDPPDPPRHRAFLAGWSDAVNGNLYGTIRSKKTHQNMGNLFGWIYGDQPEAFRVATWERYTDALDIDEED